MRRDVLIAPSMLSADFANLGGELDAIVKAGADWIHLDVMDGAFVPNITFGAPVIKALRRRTDRVFDCHLMIEAPERYIADFAAAGCDVITVHAEATTHLDRTLQAIRALGKRAGVALNPSTPESAITYVLDRLDLILLMTVNPGFGGQSYVEAVTDKIAAVRDMIGERDIRIEVDGGITSNLAPIAIEAGADVLVAGTAVFGSGPSNYAANIAALRPTGVLVD